MRGTLADVPWVPIGGRRRPSVRSERFSFCGVRGAKPRDPGESKTNDFSLKPRSGKAIFFRVAPTDGITTCARDRRVPIARTYTYVRTDAPAPARTSVPRGRFREAGGQRVEQPRVAPKGPRLASLPRLANGSSYVRTYGCLRGRTLALPPDPLAPHIDGLKEDLDFVVPPPRDRPQPAGEHRRGRA